ncbi:mediator of hyperadherence YidE [Klebsiella pneumoniae subsp. ozaenae]|uniref:Mediator of hyperadherence YidE n=1 Tax=Klebsiella pneumoniae subsp. ozaenae TaxID=574 RepID=A0A377YUR6_KLEPO|nr:mediator of hyperadherence YidE [Klebsiella pneumoniae subsp. ozaenae]
MILFVYTIGIQVAGLFRLAAGLRPAAQSVRYPYRYPRRLVTAVLHKLFNIPLPVVLGISPVR